MLLMERTFDISVLLDNYYLVHQHQPTMRQASIGCCVGIHYLKSNREFSEQTDCPYDCESLHHVHTNDDVIVGCYVR